jgi:hypothetical protein
MSTEQLDRRRERAARNQSLFREVNEQIDILSRTFLDEPEVSYVCECLDLTCIERIAIPHDVYERIRRNPTEFFVAPGHEDAQVEEVVDRDPRWVVVRKLGAGASVASDSTSAGEESRGPREAAERDGNGS